MPKNLTATEAISFVVSDLEKKGVQPTDSILKNPDRVTLMCTGGAVFEEIPAGADSFRVTVTHNITFTKEYEITVNDEDKVTYKEYLGG